MAKKRLSVIQVETLDLLSKYTDYTYMTGQPTLRVLLNLGLVEHARIGKYKSMTGWRLTHDGMIVLKQNGHYPPDPALRASVRDPRVPQ